MIDKTKHPKTVEDFDKWLKRWISSIEIEATKFIFNFKGNMDVIKFFYSLSEEMQTGVYLSYFDECGVSDSYALTAIVLRNIQIAEQPNRITKALKATVIEATELREKQLK